MSSETLLKAEKRSDAGKGVARKLRASGKVPAVVYGKDEETLSLSIDAHDAEYLFRSISTENTIVDLEIDGEKGAIPTLVKEIQVHPLRQDLVHVDFLRVRAGVMLDVAVPIHLEGTAAGVKDDGGTLQQIIYELPMSVLPSKIPESIVVDVSALAVGDSIHVYDLELDEDFEVQIDSDRTIATVAAPRLIEEEGAEEEEELEGVEGEEAPSAEGEEGDEAGDSDEEGDES